MLAHKHMPKIAAALMAVAVCLCLVASVCSDALMEALGSDGSMTMEYGTALFDTSAPLTVNIVMDGDDWQEMLDNAMAEEYYTCNVEINGETFYQVGIRPKGNTSLSSIASDPTTDRYSFKLEFDRYVDGQTCYGLDKLVLNNNYADATAMKEALVYDMYQFLGADASLYNYAAIYVNGEYWGAYLALEAVEDSFLLRNYGLQSGALYKPEGMDMGRGHMGDDSGFTMPENDVFPADLENMKDRLPEGMDFPQEGQERRMDGRGDIPADADMPGAPDMQDMPEMPDVSNRGEAPEMPKGTEVPDAAAVPDMPDMGEDFDFPAFDDGKGGMGGMFSSSGGADLNYTDDDLDSYDTIWDGEVTGTGKASHRRVVTALKNIAGGNDLEQYMDVDNLLKYMAVHAFSVNLDSLSGNMAHNYYLYESDGQLNLIPWDYNLAFGGFSGTADSVINDDISDPFSGTDFFDTLLENETYRARYEEYLRQLVEEYVQGGGLAEFYTRTRTQIDRLVADDPTAFYTYEEYDAAAELLYQVVALRGQSVLQQLDGGEGQVDASGIDLTILGGMNNGSPGGDRPSDISADSKIQPPGSAQVR